MEILILRKNSLKHYIISVSKKNSSKHTGLIFLSRSTTVIEPPQQRPELSVVCEKALLKILDSL